MKPIVFNATVKDGMIKIPARHRKGLRKVNVVLVPEEEDIIMPQLTEAERKKNMEIIMKGVKKPSIKDPVAWQREQRKDRKLPFRD